MTQQGVKEMSNDKDWLFSAEGEKEIITLRECVDFLVNQRSFDYLTMIELWKKQVDTRDPQSVNLYMAKTFYLRGYVDALQKMGRRN
jgi:hypothetical protein